MADKKRSSKAKVNTEIPQFNIIPATPVQKSFAESEIESPQKAGPNDKRRSYVPQNYQKPSMPEESAIDFEESNHVRPIKVQWSPNLSLRSKQTNKPEERRKSSNAHLVSFMDQLLNSPTLIDRLQSEERIKDANCDTESWFIQPKTLGLLRFALTLLTTAFISISLIQYRALYFNELYGWNWLAILIYYSLGTMKSYAYLSESTANVITLPTVFDILFISTSSISVLLLVCYWLFIPIESAINISTNPLQFIGYNIGILVLFIETIVSRVAIVKHYAALVPVFVLLYVFFTWITHDQLKWPFALEAIEKYLSRGVNPYHLTIYFLVLLAVSSIPSVLVYLVISVRDALGSRVNSKKPSSDKA